MSFIQRRFRSLGCWVVIACSSDFSFIPVFRHVDRLLKGFGAFGVLLDLLMSSGNDGGPVWDILQILEESIL